MTTKNIHIYVVNLSVPEKSGPYENDRPTSDPVAEQDPFIEDLIERLQREVRADRNKTWNNRLTRSPRWSDVRCEAPPPLNEWPTERDLPDRSEHWPLIDFDSDDVDF